jgi:hypothetical protein
MTNWGGYSVATGFNVTYATKENYPDEIAAVEVFNSTLMLWGYGSIEFWQDVGGNPLPYARISGSTQEYGLAALNSRAVVNNTMYFLGNSEDGAVQVYSLNGYVPTPVSTSDIDSLFRTMILTYGSVSNAVASSYTIYGHNMYQLTFPTANRTVTYDTKSQIWHEAQTGISDGRHLADLSVAYSSTKYVSDATTGNLYYFSDQQFTDNGATIVREATTKHLRSDGNELRIGDVFLDMETGVGTISGQGSDPQISMERSIDNGRTWGQPRLRSMGKLGEYRTPRVVWRRNGSAKDVVFRFRVTDPVKFIITSGSMDLEASND